MRILLVTFSDNADHQDITFSMFENLYKANKPNVDVWLMGISTPKIDVMKTAHTLLVDCPKSPGITKKTFDFKTLKEIISCVNENKYDVIFFESLHVWNLAIMVLCHRRTKMFQMIHDIIPHQGDKQENKVRFMNRVVCKLADYIILPNKKFIDQVTELYKVPQEKVRYLDMWRSFPKYTEPKHTGKVLFFGRMNPYKGIDNLLEIVRKCPEIQFNVVGRVDSRVQELVKHLRECSNVSVNTGYVTANEMEHAFIEADWVVLPYNSATQSGVVIDGYRYGKPPIAFDVGAISEQIEDEESGYIIEAGNNAAFADKLKEVVKMDKETYATLSQKVYEYGVKKYSASGAVKRFLEVIS